MINNLVFNSISLEDFNGNSDTSNFTSNLMKNNFPVSTAESTYPKPSFLVYFVIFGMTTDQKVRGSNPCGCTKKAMIQPVKWLLFFHLVYNLLSCLILENQYVDLQQYKCPAILFLKEFL